MIVGFGRRRATSMTSRPGGGAGWSGLVIGVLIALFSVLIAVQVGMGSSMSAQTQRWLIIAACGIGGFAFVALFFAISGRGGRVVARLRPGAVIARANRSDEGRDAFREYFASIGLHRFRLSTTFWLVADSDGLAVWNTANPAASASIPWTDVESIEPAKVNMTARVSNGIVLHLRAAGRDLAVTVGFIGSGLGGMYPPAMSAVEVFVDEASKFLGADSGSGGTP